MGVGRLFAAILAFLALCPAAALAGPALLFEADSGKVIYADWTVYMQEDLEAMSDLLMMCVDIFGESSVAAAEICTIMQDQASAHAEVLDTVLPTDMAKAIEAVSELTYGGNVIPFPAARRA